MTVTKKPDHRGEHEVSRKTIAQGRPECSGEPVVTTLVCFLLCTRGCGCIGARHSPTPSVFRGERFTHTSGASRRENAKVRLCVSPSLRKQSIFRLAELQDGLLRFARNDGCESALYSQRS